jgi:pimeloyl-ACP methyl ester carboxylesterase
MQIAFKELLISYEVLGKQHKQDLVILHGWGRHHRDWLSVAEKLSHKYKVTLIDLPGFGGTTPPDEVWGAYDYANFTKQLFKHLNIKSPILLGHSFGGRVGIILAAEDLPLKQLILVDAAGIEQKTLTVKLQIAIYKIFKKLLPQGVRNNLTTSLGSDDYKRAGIMRKVLIKVVNEDLRHLLSKIKASTIVIWGEKDLNQDIKYGKIMSEEIPNAKLRVVWEAGHNPHLEKPKEFLEILEETLQ